jgi:hypothetical protein
MGQMIMIHYAKYGWTKTTCGQLVSKVTTVTRRESASCLRCKQP